VSRNPRLQKCPQEQDDTEEDETVKKCRQFGNTNSIVGQWSCRVAGSLLFVLIFLRGPKHVMSEAIAYAASKGVLSLLIGDLAGNAGRRLR
jgi:hypothetical protein